MAKEKPRTLKVGRNGEVKLPPDVLEAIGHEEGEDLRIFVDKRRKQVRLERHVDDPWGDALKKKEEKDFDDLIDQQRDREDAAKRLFDERLKDPPKGDRRPEDNPDYWR